MGKVCRRCQTCSVTLFSDRPPRLEKTLSREMNSDADDDADDDDDDNDEEKGWPRTSSLPIDCTSFQPSNLRV